MIACNYGFIRMVKYLIEKGIDINHIDNNNFNAVLYTIKANEDLMFFYLISHGGDITIKDKNGCGAVHWAAYNGNLYNIYPF